MRKAQISLELITISAFVLLIAAVVTLSSIDKTILTEKTRLFLDNKEACDMFANEVYAVSILGDGSASKTRLTKGLSVVNKTAYANNTFCKLCCNITKNGLDSFSVNEGIITLTNNEGVINVQ